MSGTLFGLGVGPGDPELLTLKAHRILTGAAVIAYPAPDDGESFARSIVAQYLRADQLEIPIIIPMRVERFPAKAVYDEAAITLGAHLLFHGILNALRRNNIFDFITGNFNTPRI